MNEFLSNPAISLLIGLLLAEGTEIAPWMARRILGTAARRIGNPEATSRYEEEWLALLDERPGKLLKLLFAINILVFAMPQLRRGYRRKRRALKTEGEQVKSPRLRDALLQLDALHHRQFEDAVRDLLRRDGCTDAVQVGGAGDLGADVMATDPYGRRWVIQCKHRRAGLSGSPVGSPDVQVLNGTGRPVHKGDVVVLVTNSRFMKPAVEFARSQQLHLVDRAVLGEWASGSRPLWELLREVPPPRRPTSLS
ncbi:restriction endonuclease [Streptomyces sp. NPDC127114]|uniref:restriction endonuclease n=1 Tax=Streptomyces sp. NPDC127114 TaxID=3345366 RepID=UPI00362B9738